MIENLSRQLEIKSQPVRIENKIAEESTAEDPRDSIFARAIRGIWGTLRYLYCSSACERDQDIYIATGKVDVMKSISTYILIENQRKGMEYFGYSNMIDCLPKEMLSHVTSFLPPKDFNSLVRTNKTTWLRLRNRDRQLMHVNYSLKYQYDDNEKNLTVISVKLDLKTENVVCKPYMFFLLPSNMPLLANEDPICSSELWGYFGNLDQCVLSCQYPNDVRDFLSLKLKSLCTYNVIVDSLILEGAQERELIDLAIVMKENRMRVTQLELIMDILGDHHMDLIHVCRPSSLKVKSQFVPSTFHEDPVVRQINELTINSRRLEMKEGSLAAYYRTQSLDIRYIHGATAQDIRLILDQWIHSTKIDRVVLYMVFEDPEAVGKNLLEQVNRQLVKVWDITAQVAYVPNKTWFNFRRIADGCQLQFGWSVRGDPNDAVFIFFDPAYDSSFLQLP